jgi:hypothetical protein
MGTENTELTQIFKWQHKLLPMMIKIIVSLTVFFFIASLGQLIYLQTRIEKTPDLDKNWIKEGNITSQLYQLEYLTILKRYHQGNTSLMSRIWLQYMGFITGMILVIIGSVFILGKLRESEAKIELDASKVKFAILSSSPGLIIAILGTFIMITTILDHNKINIGDDSVYIMPGQFSSPSDSIYIQNLKILLESLGNAKPEGDPTEEPPQ